MKEKLRPLHNNVIIKRRDPEQVTPGGIIIADDAQSKNLRGEVLAVGPGRMNDKGVRLEVSAKPGDVVLLANEYAGHEVTLAGEKYLIVRDDEITAVVEAAS